MSGPQQLCGFDMFSWSHFVSCLPLYLAIIRNFRTVPFHSLCMLYALVGLKYSTSIHTVYCWFILFGRADNLCHFSCTAGNITRWNKWTNKNKKTTINKFTAKNAQLPKTNHVHTSFSWIVAIFWLVQEWNEELERAQDVDAVCLVLGIMACEPNNKHVWDRNRATGFLLN